MTRKGSSEVISMVQFYLAYEAGPSLFISIDFFTKNEKKIKSKNRKIVKNRILGNPFFGVDFWSIFDRKMDVFRYPILDPFWTPILDPFFEVRIGVCDGSLLLGAKIVDLSQRTSGRSILGSKMDPKMAKKGSKNSPKWPFLHVKYPFFVQNREKPENGHFGVQNRSFWVILGSKMGQNRSFWVILGSKIIDFGSFLGPKCDFAKNAIFDVFLLKKRSILHFWGPAIQNWGRFLKVPIRIWTPILGVYPLRRCILPILRSKRGKIRYTRLIGA